MPKSTKAYVDKHVLISAELPAQTETYTVISHEYIINTALENLAQAGFVVKEEKYRCNMNAQIATGVYNISYDNDPDLSMVFAWTNSYDKSTRFRCAIGANVNASGASIIKDTSAWTRKHTGDALNETTETIQNIIYDADRYYSELVDIKNKMKTIFLSEKAVEIKKNIANEAEYLELSQDDINNETITNLEELQKEIIEEEKKSFGHVMGDLYFTKRLLNGDQASICMRESDKPSFQYSTGTNSLWTVYNYILCSLKITHPKLWMDTQMSVLLHFMEEYNLIEFDEEESEDTPPTMEDTYDLVEEQQAEEFEDLDAEEDEDWNKLEEAQVIAEVKEEPKHSLEGIEGGHQFTPDTVADEEADMIENEEIIEERETEESTTEMLYGVDNSGGLEMTDGLLPLVEEEVEEEVENKKIVLDKISNEEVVYFIKGDYPEAEVGSYIDLNDTIFKIIKETEVEDTVYLEAQKYNPEEGTLDAEESTVFKPFETPEPEASFEPDTKSIVLPMVSNSVESNAVPAKDTDVEHQEILDQASAEASLEFTEDSIPDNTDFTLENPVEENTSDEGQEIDLPLFTIIKKELQDLYGVALTFQVDRQDDQYNITLESGETLILSTSYIDGLLEE